MSNIKLPNSKCLECGTEFYVKPYDIARGHGKYCSKNCANLSMKVDTPNCVCEECGKEFHAHPINIERGRAKHCSNNCRYAAMKKTPNYICLECGKKFYASPSEVAQGRWKYCSSDCKKAARIKRIESNTFKCLECGKSFYTMPCRKKVGWGKYCSKICWGNASTKIEHKNSRVTRNCVYCGKEFHVVQSKSINGNGKFCSVKCNTSYHSGEKSSKWLGGISFEPYCPKWTDDLKCRIRAYFNNQCLFCAKTTIENKRKLNCHHATYNKKMCCDGKLVQFAALCNRCHNKTNKDRDRWEAIIHRIIDEIYEGRSYFTKEEWNAMNGG
jgi:DNA-directed RNA polymerase subunit RPC12/RpoP